MGPGTVPGVRVGQEGEAVLLGPDGDAPVADPRPVCAERRLEMEERAESARLMNDFSSTDESDWPPTPTRPSRKRKVLGRENTVMDIMGNPVPL